MTDAVNGDGVRLSPAVCSESGSQARLVRRTDVTVYELDGEGLVFDATRGDTHRLNATAMAIWRECDGRQDAAQIAERLTDSYDVSMAAAVEHVERLLREFQERRLVYTAF